MGYPKEEINNSTINMGRLLYLEREDERFWIISKGTYLITQLGTYKPIYLKVPQSGRLGIILTATPHGSGFSANRSSLAYKKKPLFQWKPGEIQLLNSFDFEIAYKVILAISLQAA